MDGVVVADFLYGDEFCGLIVTAGADKEQNQLVKSYNKQSIG